jgi:peptidoglycan/xylan/chitin deacetylase (PgdA/CDA1 family)
MNNEICITLDYELCLGRKTGSVYNTLIFPMEELVKVLDKYNVKATLMVDSAYLLMLKKLKGDFVTLENDYNMIVSQLKKLSDNGHSIQLHIHPQWYYSHFDGKEWKLDFKHYKLSDMDKNDVSSYFKESKLLLESIIGKSVVAFRAGGFSIQTYKEHYELLVSNNIKIDSSCAPGIIEKSKYQWYDYRCSPSQKYKFSKDISQMDELGKVLEIPISTVKFNPFHYFYLRKKKETSSSIFKSFTEGEGIAMTNPLLIRMFNLVKQLFKTKVVLASIDSFSSSLLPLVYEKYKAIPGNNCFVILGHPKAFSFNSLCFTEEFIKKTINSNVYKTIEDLQ